MTETIWQQAMTLAQMNQMGENSLVSHLGIEMLELGDDFLTGSMPVHSLTHQPFGILHGGASVVLAETLGSMAATMASPQGYVAVGVEINANHLAKVRTGSVVGTAKAYHLGRTTQVWQIEIKNELGRLICVSRMTLAIVPIPNKSPQN